MPATETLTAEKADRIRESMGINLAIMRREALNAVKRADRLGDDTIAHQLRLQLTSIDGTIDVAKRHRAEDRA